MNKLLTIGIPTYNRKDQIQKQVLFFSDFIIKNSLNSFVELLIIDNNSDFNIFDIFDKILIEHSDFITIKKNNKNIGMTKNIIETMIQSKGKYYYFIGDDDKPNLDSLLKGIRLIRENINLPDVIIYGVSNCLGYKQIFKNIKKNTFQILNNIYSKIPIYYIGNACMFVSTKNLDILSEKENQNIFESTTIPHSAFAFFLLKKKDRVGLYNIEILDENFDEMNNVVTSWSEFHSRFYNAFLLDINLKLPKIDFSKRHPIIYLKNIPLFLLKISLFYHFQDSEKQQLQFREYLEKSLLSPSKKIMFRLVTSNLFKLLAYVAISFKFLLKEKKIFSMRGLKNFYKIRNEKRLKKPSTHHWTVDFDF